LFLQPVDLKRLLEKLCTGLHMNRPAAMAGGYSDFEFISVENR
jgi:hypothetical protein